MLAMIETRGMIFFLRINQLSRTTKAKKDMLSTYKRLSMKKSNTFETKRTLRTREANENVSADSRFLTPWK